MSAAAAPPRALGVGLLGSGAIGRVHAHAYRVLAHVAEEPAVVPVLTALAGRPGSAAKARLGFARRAADWRELIADPRVELFDNCGPNDLHAEATIAAAEAGRHVLCEKPLGRDADEAFEIWRRVAAAGVRHMCAFNLRFVPALRLARELVEAGEIGELRHVRARFMQDWRLGGGAGAGAGDGSGAAGGARRGGDRDGWRQDPARAGTGALGDLGSHLVDLVRRLAGEPLAVTGVLSAFGPRRDGVDDAFAATVVLAGGATGTLEGSRCCAGARTALTFELNGTEGSLAFELAALNELRLARRGEPGSRTISVTAAEHPSIAAWWPSGRVVGWEHAFVQQLGHALRAAAGETEVGSLGATFEDGYRAAEVCDAIARAAASGSSQAIAYRELETTAPAGARTEGAA